MRHKFLAILLAVLAAAGGWSRWREKDSEAALLRPELWTQAAEQPLIWPCGRAWQPVELDGRLAEWRDVPYLPLGLLYQTGFNRHWGGRRDLSARLRARWDEKYLYLAAEVLDERLLVAGLNGDSVEWTLQPLSSTPETTPPVLHFFLVPGEGDRAAAVLEVTSRKPLPGAEIAFQKTTEGYTLETRVPWSVLGQWFGVTMPPPVPFPTLEPPTFACTVKVNDFDRANRPKGSLRWCGYRWPQGTTAPRPLTRLALVNFVSPEELLTYAPALVPVGTERNYYLESEDVTVIALSGLPPGLRGTRLSLEIVDAEGMTIARRGEEWTDRGFVGRRWRWRTPPTVEAAFLLHVTLGGGPGRPEGHSFGLLRSAGDEYRTLLNRLENLRQAVAEREARPPPEQATFIRQQAPSLLMQLEHTRNSYKSFPTWSVRSDLDLLASTLDDLAQKFADLQAGKNPFAGQRGVILKAYRSPIDDSLQPYSLYIPEDYDQGPPPPPVPTPPAEELGGNGGSWATGQLGNWAVGLLGKGTRELVPSCQVAKLPTSPPASSSPAPWPLLVTLHGYGGYCHPAASYSGFVVVSAQGRGNGDYKLWCEVDVMKVIEEVTRDYRIDPHRIYLYGVSMGGTGSWSVGTHFPDRFAALGPVAGNADHHVWEREWGWTPKRRSHNLSYAAAPKESPLRDLREYIESREDAVTFAENLRHVPVYCVHGDQDAIVPVGHARSMIKRLKELGYTYVYDEQAGIGHGGFVGDALGKLRRWLKRQVRPEYPPHVTFKTAYLRYKGAYWVEVLRFDHWLDYALIDAQVGENNTVRVTTSNLARYALQLNEHLVDVTQPVRIETDGQLSYEGPLPEDGRLVLERQEGKWKLAPPRQIPPGREKNAQLEGPIEHAFMSRFLLVYGTAGADQREKETNRRMAEEFAEKWKRWSGGARARLKADTEVTEQDIRESNLILYGGPKSNRLTARINDALPIRFTDEAILLGEREFRGEDVGLKMCYPNPLNPERYVVIFAGLTWKGTWGINSRFGNWFDWGIFDDRNWFDFGIFDSRTQSPETWLAVGFFDQDWQLNPRYIFYGDPQMRAEVVPRKVPEKTVIEPAEVVYLSDFVPKRIVQEKGTVGFDQSFGGYPITLGQRQFAKGLGVHPQAEVVYDLGGKFRTFEAYVGIDLEGAEKVSRAREDAEKVEFQVYGDGKLLASTGIMRWNSAPRHIYLSVEGVKELKLVAARRDGRKWLFGHASWGLARLEGLHRPQVMPPYQGGYEELSLEGTWLLEPLELGQGAEGAVYEPSPYVPRDLPALVPGTVQAALMAQGRLPNLYTDQNAEQARWVEEKEWWHYRWAEVPAAWRGRAVQLVLEGVNYQADVWINGRSVGSVTGMYQPGKLEVEDVLNYGGRNFFALRVVAAPTSWTHPPGSYRRLPRAQALMPGLFYGLKEAPSLLPLGLWGRVFLRATGPVRLAPPRVEIGGEGGGRKEGAWIVVHAVVTNLAEESLPAVLHGEIKPTNRPVTFTAPLTLQPGEEREVKVRVEIPEARWWWPHDWGEQPLYRLNLWVEAPRGVVSDRRSTTFGLRTVSLVPAMGMPSGDRTSHRAFALNGQPLDLRVAVWVRPDLLLREEAARTEQLIRLAREAGFNALRVWGGSGPETEAFYDLCDRYGMLVLQDFPLAQADYGSLPLEPFAQAAAALVQRLRNHPSLLLWIGGSGLNPDTPGNRRVLARLAQVVAQQDPRRPFQPVAAETGVDTFWFPQTGPTPYQTFWTAVSLYNLPAVLAAPFAPGQFLRDKLWPFSARWEAHGARPEATVPVWSDYGPAHDAADYVRKTQLAQATAYRRWLDLRHAQAASAKFTPPNETSLIQGHIPHSALSNFVLWRLNDPWPCFSPSLVDWYGVPKPGYYMVKRALRRPYLFAVSERTQWTAGEEFTADVCLWPEGTGEEQTVTATLLRTDLTVLHRETYTLSAAQNQPRATPQPLGTLRWRIPDYFPETTLLLRLTLEAPAEAPEMIPPYPEEEEFYGEREVGPGPSPLVFQADNLYWFGVAPRRYLTARLRVLWAGAEGPGRRELWAYLERCGVLVSSWKAGANPVGYHALVLGETADGQVPFTEAEQEQIQRVVESGTGLLFDGALAWLAGTRLESLLPVYAYQPQTALGPHAPKFLIPSHPVLTAVDPKAWPSSPASAYFELRSKATVLAELGTGLPLLVESAAGRGRVLAFLTTPAYRRTLLLWPERKKFYAALLGYLGKLPYTAFAELLQTQVRPPFAGLAELPEVDLEVSVTEPLSTLAPTAPLTFPITVENLTEDPVLQVVLSPRDLPSGVQALFSDNCFPLFPTQRKTVEVTLSLSRRAFGSAKIKVAIGGWKVKTETVEVRVELGEV